MAGDASPPQPSRASDVGAGLLGRLDVESRPALAPDVELVGELRATGLVERQWLVRRSERFIQLSELLYRVAEQLDGARTLDEIAASVTSATRWQVTAENVRQVIDLKLAPLGLVRGEHVPVPRSPTADGSPFRISGRRTLISAAAVQRVSSALAPLFSLAVMLPALTLIVLAHVWLYFVHGAGEGLHVALYSPGGLLLLLGVMLVSSLFHEFGHAAALRYGGGQPGAVGGGFYLVYPTLFTNTSDAYRLGRGARLRTDLGGVYFHLLFALVMTGVAVAVDQPVLFAVAVVIDLEVIYQFLPTARLDGYWAVADALGVPDPLSHARLYVASSLQAPSGASRPPAIRPRPAAALALYLSVSFVLVSAIFALTLADLPQIITRVANLVRHHAHTLHEAAVKHDVLVAAAIALLWSSGFYWAPHIPVSLGKGVAAPVGTRTFDVGSGAAVPVPAPYRQHPPVGGDYAVQWQNCGFYTAPVVDSRAVHSLARGAVWIAYRPGLPRPEVALLHAVAEQLPFILVSPYRGLRSPVVMSAWGRQLSLPGIGDPRLAQFIAAYRLSDSAPEAGKPCAGGIGRPAR